MSNDISPLGPPAMRVTISVDDDNACDVWIPNTYEAHRLLANVIERAGLRGTIETSEWPS